MFHVSENLLGGISETQQKVNCVGIGCRLVNFFFSPEDHLGGCWMQPAVLAFRFGKLIGGYWVHPAGNTSLVVIVSFAIYSKVTYIYIYICG